MHGLLTWKEFIVDLNRQKLLNLNPSRTDFNSFQRTLAETGQQDDCAELILARQQALSRTGPFADWTPKMAYNYHFGDLEAFYTESFARARANHPFNSISTPPPPPPPTAAATTLEASSQASTAPRRLKRAAAEQASAAWAGLSPQKRQRRK